MSASPPSPSQVAALLGLAATVLPADPPRLSRVAFWDPGGSAPGMAGLSGVAGLSEEELTVVLPGADGAVGPVTVRTAVLPVAAALPVLTRARAARHAAPAARYWGAAAVLALQLAARGRLLPGVTAGEHDAWRLGPLDAADAERLRELAEAMPPHAHAVPLPEPDAAGGPLLPRPAELLRAFLDAVADGLPRTPAAALAAGSPAFAAGEPVRVPERRAWANEVAAGHDAGVGLSLRMELLEPPTGDGGNARFRAVLQAHSLADPGVVVDAAALWSDEGPGAEHFGPGARRDALLTLRRAVAAWEPLSPLLTAAVPDAVELADDEVAQLLGEAANRALEGAGVPVHWPRDVVRGLTAEAEIGQDEGPARGAAPGLLSPGALLAFRWRFAVGDVPLSRAELDRLAEAGRPLVRLRERWVLLDPEALARVRRRQDTKVTVGQALNAVLTGDTEVGGERVAARATGWLAELRERLADPERAAAEPVAPPPELRATLRDYQRHGLDWLHRMTSLGLGACLADDMGLGKTVTLIALHLHRQRAPATAGPTLVVAPASLLGNWQREIGAFAPGTPVRRFHGSERELSELAPGAFVLTTYGTMRRDAARLAEVEWSLLVADEAQQVKNAFSATARELRTIPAGARVALTGTPVENNLSELWAILDWATPGLLGSLPAFRRRFADAAEDGGDPAATERLARLVRPFLLRRRKSDPGIAPELPPKTETDRAVPLTPEQAGLYEAVVREGLAEVAGSSGVARRGMVVRLLTSLKQICNHPAQYLKEERPRLAGRSGKLEAFEELVDAIVAGGSSVLVFTQYVRMARLLEARLAERGVASLLLHGGTPVARREELVRRFSEGEAPVFLLSLRAAGTGLNLTRADHVVHFDRWWNPAVEAQATDRAYRIGQDRPVQVHRLIAEGTVEDRIAALLRRKQALADAVLGGGEAALTELSDAELAELVTLRREPAGPADARDGSRGSGR
ncbi:ATP-dependent helicase [Streptomyces sp. 3MP-14]|uniref:ATP-dependent helicase n=1 Tax=Streptomyces mimosae TaxID=2586635 RepID=A0A5N6A2I1_9ACTN|nr:MULTISPECIES: DEAD/DEAH box helicase [Streptomyces]KAB8162987.1 ATP-dependent helicase [Streptomyces mimosae]KAB8179202.1 ATP-dependent helicase [Streptomyces sp. 3MP-14]